MSLRDLSGTTAVVTGASRGFGRATAVALAGLGARVVGIARTAEPLRELTEQLGGRFVAEVADVTEPDLAERVVAQYRPRTLVLNAGATPAPAPLSEQTFQTFSANWDVDVRHVFAFAKQALLAPLDPGSVVISLSSGAALAGSPLSGGYAPAKSAIRFISGYAGLQSQQDGSGLRFVAVLPQLTPATALGREYTDLYAARAGLSRAQFLARFGGELSTEAAAKSIAEIAADDTWSMPAYLLTAHGLKALDQ
jgi:NAD(P)-dependent dehydrogenase (short-subunit alcohol dehydrogenase family)